MGRKVEARLRVLAARSAGSARSRQCIAVAPRGAAENCDAIRTVLIEELASVRVPKWQELKPLGFTQALDGFRAGHGYDPASRLSLLTQDMPGTGRDQEQRFARCNPAGQIMQQTRSNDLHAHTGAANRTTACTTNGLNQYIPASGSSVPS